MWECEHCGEPEVGDSLSHCYKCGYSKDGSPPGDQNEEMTLGKLLFSFNGRIPRGKYWAVQVSMIGLGFIIGAFIGAVGSGGDGSGGGAVAGVIGVITFILLFVICVWVGLAVVVKRWHDIGVSGWAVLTMVPYIGPIALGCISGTTGPNKYGEDPL